MISRQPSERQRHSSHDIFLEPRSESLLGTKSPCIKSGDYIPGFASDRFRLVTLFFISNEVASSCFELVKLELCRARSVQCSQHVALIFLARLLYFESYIMTNLSYFHNYRNQSICMKTSFYFNFINKVEPINLKLYLRS